MNTYKSFEMELLLEETVSDYQIDGNNRQFSNAYLMTPFAMRGEPLIPTFPSNSQPNCTPFHLNGASMNDNVRCASTNMINVDMDRFKYPPPNWKSRITKTVPVNVASEAVSMNRDSHSNGHGNDHIINHNSNSSNGTVIPNSRNNYSNVLRNESPMDLKSVQLPSLPKDTTFNFTRHHTNNDVPLNTRNSSEMATIDLDCEMQFTDPLFNATKPGKFYDLSAKKRNLLKLTIQLK